MLSSVQTFGVTGLVCEGGIQKHITKKGRLFRTVKLLNQLHYFCVKSQLELQGQMYNLGGFPEQSLSLAPHFPRFFFLFLLRLTVLNCRLLPSHILKAVCILCLIFPLQKTTSDESEETNTHILGRNRSLSELGVWKHTKAAAREAAEERNSSPEL